MINRKVNIPYIKEEIEQPFQPDSPMSRFLLSYKAKTAPLNGSQVKRMLA